MSDKKFGIADLLGTSNLLKQLLEENYLSDDECNTILRRLAEENGFSEIDIMFFKRYIHGKNLISVFQSKI